PRDGEAAGTVTGAGEKTTAPPAFASDTPKTIAFSKTRYCSAIVIPECEVTQGQRFPGAADPGPQLKVLCPGAMLAIAVPSTVPRRDSNALAWLPSPSGAGCKFRSGASRSSSPAMPTRVKRA